ncbi:MAG: hypothetical protein M0P04_11190, partial [Syntrophales bacterium]|nr:hypothetical protein [Syntrophales bacterium]
DLQKETRATVSSSTIISAQQVDIDATSSGTIWVLTIGGVGSGGKAEQNFGGAISVAGAASVNTIASTVEAFIDQSTVTTTVAGSDISLTADDRSAITANAGILSIAVGLGSKALAASLGASVAINSVSGGIRAYSEDSTLTSAGGLDLTATSGTTIWAMTLAGVGAGGKGTGSFGLAFSGAGAGSLNTVERSIEAYIEGGGAPRKTVATGNGEGVVLRAVDNSSILAIAGTLSVAVGIGASTGVGGSMGASVNINTVRNTIDTHISDTKVVSAGIVDLDSVSNATIWSLAIAGSVGVGVGKPAATTTGGGAGGQGGTGVGVAISGAVTVNVVDNRTVSYIDQGSHVTSLAGGAVSLDAKDNTQIMADAGGVSLAVGSGERTGVGVAIGGSVAVNVVSNETLAYISGSTIGTEATPVGAVSVTAAADSRIWALTIAGSLSVGYGKSQFGGALAGAVAGSVNSVRNTVEAGISDSVVVGSAGLSLSATDGTAIIANAVGGSLSVGAGKTGLAMAVGGAFAINAIGNTVRSYVDGSSLDLNGALAIASASDSSIWGLAVGAAMGVGVGSAGGTGASLSIGASVARNEIGNATESYIKDSGSILTGGGDVTISAVDSAAIQTYAVAASVSVGVGKGNAGVALSGGGSVAENIISSTTNAYIDKSNLGTLVDPVGNVNLGAISSSEILAIVPAVAASVAYGGKAGVGAAIGVAIARNIIGGQESNVPTDYTTDSTPAVIRTGDTVKVADGGPRDGDVYEYLGPDHNRFDYSADAGSVALAEGDRVWVDAAHRGLATTGIYRYVGDDATVDLATSDYTDTDIWEHLDMLTLQAQEFGDPDTWRRVDLDSAASEIQAYIRNSSIQASGDLTADAVSTQSIDSIVIAGAVALAGGGKAGIAISGAGVYAENAIATDVRAFINGDGATGISAGSIALVADDSSSIQGIAGAASIAGSVGGKAGVSVSIGLSLAFNRVDNRVEAFIANADQGVTTSNGSISLSAETSGPDAITLDPSAYGFTFDDLDDASKQDQDNPDDPLNDADNAADPTDDAVDEAAQDAVADAAILAKLKDALIDQGIDLVVNESVSGDAMFTTVYGEQAMVTGDTVKVVDGFTHGGEPGGIYKYLVIEDYASDKTSGVTVTTGTIVKDVDDGAFYEFVGTAGEGAAIADLSAIDFATDDLWESHTVDLSAEDYSDTTRWKLVTPNLRLTRLVEGEGWTLIDGSGKAYILKKSGANLSVSQATINVVSAAASLGVGIGLSEGAGVAVSGAGAFAQNVILSKTNTSIRNSVITSAVDVLLNAESTQGISSTVVAASLAVGGGGKAGVGVSIGVSIARNLIGYEADLSTAPSEVRAYIQDSSINADGDLVQTALANQTINSAVIAASVGIGASSKVGVGVSGSGVWSENWIGVDVESSIDGDGATG